jgi:hypothetical protein
VLNDEAAKKLRGVYGVWKAYELLVKEYPQATILLMDNSASFDILVIDPTTSSLVAVEVKAPQSSSKSARRLSKAQRELKGVIESRQSWRLIHKKCVLYGDPGKDAHAEFVGEGGLFSPESSNHQS